MNNVREFPKDKIVRPKLDNLVLIHRTGMPVVIGQKYGREIRRPLYFRVSEMVEGKVTYSLGVIPFVQDSIFIEGSYMFHYMTNEQVQESYLKIVFPVIPAQGG